ncbi:PREDICTED: zinc finger CCCH domain-containing protein 17 [Nelumbo nucifera]|uniref:Zinc finger CCCH domain-containing protein 17 n=1 Tax=Nelumbo nucifera TaxID=4432 RepID=A0A1U7ZAT2_NELNU|nr:PREDICTED: zinc finger CCCH domain-containing protein 17 [Nelumbo nucifera]
MEAATRDSSQLPVAAEEESLKKNTDCVYFLASPLTCKKGSECEYRHSEPARINPRDCWFWLNGNCLNPKCSFRHPPLDGFLGTQGASSVGSSLSPQAGISTQMPPAFTAPAHGSGKQPTPCFFFQKGLCLKGDRCPFMHGPQPLAPKVAPTVTEPQISKKTSFGGLEKCTTQQQNIPKQNTINQIEVPPPEKSVMKTETALPKNGIAAKKNVQSDDEQLRYKPANIPAFSGSSVSRPVNAPGTGGNSLSRPANAPGASGNSVSRPHCSRQAQVLDDRSFQNGKEGDEILGESSPGFDVLVDNELRNSHYYQNVDEYGSATDHDGRNLNSAGEFDYGCSVDYDSVNKFDQEPYIDSRGYDPYGRAQDHYPWEQHRASSVSERLSLPDKRGYPRGKSPDQIGESDLRHRLSKQRRLNGSRSIISSNCRDDGHRRNDHEHHFEDQRNQDRSWRETSNLPRENSISNRLQGRITLPGRSSSPDSNNSSLRPEREMNRGRSWGRSSPPGRGPISSYQGRHQDRIKRRGQEDDNIEGRNFRAPLARRDDIVSTLDFAGPKSLAELKGSKHLESTEDQEKDQETKARQVFPCREQQNSKIGKLVAQESEDSLSFEGPKPLSVLLKRKREAETTSGNIKISDIGEESSPRSENFMGGSRMTAITETQSDLPSERKKEDDENIVSNQEKSKSSAATVEDDEEGQIFPEDNEVAHEDEPYAQDGTEFEAEDATMLDDTFEDQELETFDQRGGESDYEQTGGQDKTEDENLDPEEYLDDEDGDDFAKRIGVMFS